MPCRHSTRFRAAKLTTRKYAVLTLLLLPVTLAGSATAQDSRLMYSADSPRWLGAIGRLHVPTLRHINGRTHHFVEDCSATLIGRAGRRSASLIVTAWHCLEDYSDYSREILFTPASWQTGVGGRTAYPLASGGSMAADWAILRLQQPISVELVRPLLVHGASADPAQTLAMAGFSRDAGLGADGARLTYDPACRIRTESGSMVNTDCHAHKGASGGAVVQLTKAGDPRYCGVISEGDSEGISRFVPLKRFRDTLEHHLRRTH